MKNIFRKIKELKSPGANIHLDTEVPENYDHNKIDNLATEILKNHQLEIGLVNKKTEYVRDTLIKFIKVIQAIQEQNESMSNEIAKLHSEIEELKLFIVTEFQNGNYVSSRQKKRSDLQ